jgi:membrane associated rhomboid family serine protease
MASLNVPRIHFNAPTVLILSFLCILVHMLSIDPHCAVPGRGGFNLNHPLDYLKLFTHVLGHGSWEHLFGNLTLILLLGPILEDRYQSGSLAIMVIITALITGLANVLLSKYALMGASGIVYMFIILASIVNIRGGTIPLTFLLVAVVFIGKEIIAALDQKDNISQMAHIVGGIIGAFLGFKFKR